MSLFKRWLQWSVLYIFALFFTRRATVFERSDSRRHSNDEHGVHLFSVLLIKRYVDDAVYFLNVSLYMLSSARTIFSQKIDVFIQNKDKWLSENHRAIVREIRLNNQTVFVYVLKFTRCMFDVKVLNA